MTESTTITLLLLLAAVAWLWWDGLRAKEAAVRSARAACRRHGVQLLDETVHLNRMGLARDGRGQVRIRRYYRFEFSQDALSRYQGGMELLGPAVLRVHLDMPGHSILDEE